MSTVAYDTSLYREILTKNPPHVIRTEEENEKYLVEVENLLSRANLSAEEREYADLLIVLIEKFEEQYQIQPAATPLDVLLHLMDAHDLKQADLANIFGGKGNASAVLNGKRGLSRIHIQRLSERFHVSPAIFFDAPR